MPSAVGIIEWSAWVVMRRHMADSPPLNQHFPLLKWKQRAPPGQTWPYMVDDTGFRIQPYASRSDANLPSSTYRREDIPSLLDDMSVTDSGSQGREPENGISWGTAGTHRS